MAAGAPSIPADPERPRPPGIWGRLSTARVRTGSRAGYDEALARAKTFAERYAGKLDELDSAGLAVAMGELAEILDLVGRAGSYAALDFSTDTADPARGALLQRTQERGTEIETTLLFFELEWAALPDERVRGAACGRRGPGVLPPSPAQRAPLPRSSAQ